jgi:hypothetical protein
MEVLLKAFKSSVPAGSIHIYAGAAVDWNKIFSEGNSRAAQAIHRPYRPRSASGPCAVYNTLS